MILSGNPVDYLVAFSGGFLLSFTPCVYPLIPISVTYIGVGSGGSKFKGFLLSLVYVTGVAITYSLLGLLASLTGTFFGSISSHPLVYFFAGIIIIIFGLSMLDIFTITLPPFFKLPGLKKHPPSLKLRGIVLRSLGEGGQNYFSTFILGLSSGLMVSPCITPVLGGILVYLTTKRNLLYGATLLFSFAYGMGFVLVLVGTFSAILVNIPKSGKWMLYIKRLFSFILIGMGVYFIFKGLKEQPLEKKPVVIEEKIAQKLKLASDFNLQDLNHNTFTLNSYKDKQPVVLFFWTTWCPFCRRELRALNDQYPRLVKEGWEVLAIDVGEPLSKVVNFVEGYELTFKVLLDEDTNVANDYGILGVPTYILVDKKGYIRFQDHYFPNTEYKNLLSESKK